jgi:hypothetical protein
MNVALLACTLMMSTPEERRQRILANSEARLAKLRDANRYDNLPDMAPVASPAPANLLKKTNDEPTPVITPTVNNNNNQTSIFSTITSAMNMMNSFTSSSKTKSIPEVTEEMLVVDKQHILVLILGIFVGLLYSFYISSHSNFFFLVYFTSTICILTSRYYMMQMKHRTNALITTAMLSGFRPELMKKFILVYTLVCDGWVIFAFYFVSFCLTHVMCSLF